MFFWESHPTLLQEWNFISNPTGWLEAKSNSKFKADWICSKQHQWSTTIQSRVKGTRCPYCSGRRATPEKNLKTLYPNIAKEWHPTKNGNLTPEQILPSSDIRVWWQCSKNHEWQAVAGSRTAKRPSGCPYCAGKLPSPEYNLAVKFPTIAEQWHPTKNDFKPDNVVPKSNKKVWWLCSKNHEWMSKVSNRIERGCPYCSGRKASAENNLSLIAHIASEWHPTKNGNLTPNQVTKGSKHIYWFRCKKGHEWQAYVTNRTTHHQGCPRCFNVHTYLEKFVEHKLQIERFNRRGLLNFRYKPDFKLADNTYLNVDGLYFHSEKFKPKEYHLKMRKAFETENKRILQFYQDEIYEKWPIIESIIFNTLGKTSNLVSARSCVIEKIDRKRSHMFYSFNHLMGPYDIAIHYGLFLGTELVSIISIRTLNDTIIIERFCNKINTSVRGGFQKLLAHISKNHSPKKIISFCDLRYATGKSYEKAGFKLETTSLGWCWTNYKRRYNRLLCKAGNGRTELEIAQELGWLKVYDAGQAKYVLTL